MHGNRKNNDYNGFIFESFKPVGITAYSSPKIAPKGQFLKKIEFTRII